MSLNVFHSAIFAAANPSIAGQDDRDRCPSHRSASDVNSTSRGFMPVIVSKRIGADDINGQH